VSRFPCVSRQFFLFGGRDKHFLWEVLKNLRVLLLDCPRKYKKGENQTNVELSKEEDW
jgi:hypothetical protein